MSDLIFAPTLDSSFVATLDPDYLRLVLARQLFLARGPPQLTSAPTSRNTSIHAWTLPQNEKAGTTANIVIVTAFPEIASKNRVEKPICLLPRQETGIPSMAVFHR